MILRQFFLTLLLGLLGILIQGTVIKALLPGVMVPSLLLIVVVFLAFYQPTLSGLLQAFLLGLMFDMCSGILIGPWSGSFVVVFGLISSLSQRIFVESPVAAMLTVFFSSLLSNAIFYLVVLQVRHSGMVLSWSLLVEALLTAVVSVPLFSFFRRLLLPSENQVSRRVGAHA